MPVMLIADGDRRDISPLAAFIYGVWEIDSILPYTTVASDQAGPDVAGWVTPT